MIFGFLREYLCFILGAPKILLKTPFKRAAETIARYGSAAAGVWVVASGVWIVFSDPRLRDIRAPRFLFFGFLASGLRAFVTEIVGS